MLQPGQQVETPEGAGGRIGADGHAFIGDAATALKTLTRAHPSEDVEIDISVLSRPLPRQGG